MERFGLDDAVKVLNNGSLHKIRDPEKYDLIIIDGRRWARSNDLQ